MVPLWPWEWAETGSLKGKEGGGQRQGLRPPVWEADTWALAELVGDGTKNDCFCGAGSALPWVLMCGVMVDHCCDGAQGGGCFWVTPLSMGFQYAEFLPLAKRDFSWSISVLPRRDLLEDTHAWGAVGLILTWEPKSPPGPVLPTSC